MRWRWPGRERLPGLADLGVVALGQPQDQLVHVRALRGAHHFGGVRLAEARDVLRHRAAEELHVLRQVAEVRPELLARPGRDVGAVQAHHARSRLPDADDEARQRRLARRARPDQAERLARRELEGNAAQDRRLSPQPEDDALRRSSLPSRRRQLGAGVRRRIGRSAARRRRRQALRASTRLRQPATSVSTGASARPSRIVAAIITPGGHVLRDHQVGARRRAWRAG